MELCEKWRNRTSSPGQLHDVYDGQMCQHFQYDPSGSPFLAGQNSYLFMLNCDWFQPFRHAFTVGVLYLALENLPRDVRFK